MLQKTDIITTFARNYKKTSSQVNGRQSYESFACHEKE